MSEHRRKYDLTHGPILNKLLLVALPIMGSQLLQMSYNLTDMFWLGRVGEDAVAASGTAGMYMWLSVAFMIIGQMGAEIGVSQSMGRGDREGAKRYAQNAFFLALTLGCVFGLAMVLFRQPLVGFFNIQDPNVAKQTEAYLLIVALAIPLNFLSAVAVGSFNASGNSRIPFIVNAVGLVFNMVLDPLMILVFGWGIEGAAIATVLSQVVSFSLMLTALKRVKNRPFEAIKIFVRPEMLYIRQILRWSIPIGLESMFFTLLSMITSRLVAGFGTQAMAVSRVGSQIESLTWLIGGGYGSALTAFVGQNYGAGKWTRIRKGFSISARAMLVYGSLVTLLIFFGGGFLFSIFLPNPEIVEMGRTYLRILAICQIPQCFEAVAGSTFKGIGRTLPPALVSVICNIIRVFASYALAASPLGLSGIWLAIALSASLRGMWGFVWFLIYQRKLPKVDTVVA